MRLLRAMPRGLIWSAAIAALLIFAARQIYRLPDLDKRVASYSLGLAGRSAIGARVAGLMESHSDTSGVYPLFHGAEAYAARVLLARAARHSIDARYSIWQKDETGLPLLGALLDASQRGVRVRLLVDDNGTPDLDRELAALNQLDNFEMRVFNPFTLRQPKLVPYLFDFPRLNRRMHNKSFAVDSAVTVVGGRNVGDNRLGSTI